jgi:ParB family transcriptional regulator, chromosome partitioning protein
VTNTKAPKRASAGVPALPTIDELPQHLEVVDPRTLLLDRNVRLDATADEDLIESVRVHGVLQPPAVVRAVLPDGNGEGNDYALRVKMGHRRTLAAIEVGYQTIVVIVAGDEATDDPGQIDRVLEQLAENDARKALDALDHVHAFEQLAAFGLTPDQIAKRTRKPAAAVKASLAIGKSETAKNALMHQDLTLEQAAVLAEFDGDTDAQAQVLTVIEQRYNFEYRVQQLREQRETARVFAAARETLAGRNVTLAEQPKMNRWGEFEPAAWKRLDQLAWSEEDRPKTIDRATHEACEGHAAVVDWFHGDVVKATKVPVAAAAVVLSDVELTRDEPEACPVCRCTEERACMTLVPYADEDLPEGVEPGSPESFYDDPCDWSEFTEGGQAVCTGCVTTDGTILEEKRVMPPEEPVDPEETVNARWVGPVWVCTTPSVHVPRYAQSTGSGPRPKAADMEPAEREKAKAERKDVVQSNKDMDTATVVRRKWLKTFVTRKTPPKGTGGFLAATVADDSHVFSSDGKRLAHQLLGLKTTGSMYGQGSDLAKAAEKATEGRAQVILLATVLAACEQNMDRTSWRRRLGYEQRYLAFLRDCCGYEVAPVEERVITGKAPGAKATKPKAKPKAKAEPKTPEEVAAEQAEWSAGYDKQGGEGSPAPVVESSAGAYIDPDDEPYDRDRTDLEYSDVDEDDDEFGERVMSRPVEDVDLPDGDAAVPV